jgi:hypothetical protein
MPSSVQPDNKEMDKRSRIITCWIFKVKYINDLLGYEIRRWCTTALYSICPIKGRERRIACGSSAGRGRCKIVPESSGPY